MGQKCRQISSSRPQNVFEPLPPPPTATPPLTYTDKKEKKIFFIYKEIQMGSGAVIYEEGFPNTVYEEMRKYLVIYEEALSNI